MGHFSIMLLPESGPIKNYRINRRLLKACAVALVSLTVFGSWGLYDLYNSNNLKADLQDTRHQLELARTLHDQEIARLHSQVAAEKKKMSLYARTLGQLQARISRLDSLGEKLVDVSSLDKKEFDFGLQPAFGGPRLVQASLAGDIGLSDHMQHISTRLSNLDTQLAAIDYLLQGNRIESSARPHAWPSEGGWLSSRFGIRADPFTGERAAHRGVDIANRHGAPVLSTSRGVVTFAGKMKDFGYMVDIEHGYGYKTRYGHLSSLAVKVGDEVSYSQLVGRVGSSGRSTGPHLHYEVHRNGKSLDPVTFLPRG
ncbi:MAG: M23 family metallopeptidase [Mariprofundaceae bacterium]|nr:M23 family metallopeptidase [Mariprofundaceae bacterium]